MPFEKIMYKGKEVMPDVDDTVGVAYYQHIYRSTYGTDKSEHVCVLWGHWCWRQILRHPIGSAKQWRRRLVR